jgi:Protein of unknown function DUF262
MTNAGGTDIDADETPVALGPDDRDLTMPDEVDVDEDDDYTEPLQLQGDRRLITQPYDYSIQQLVDELRRGKIRLDIEYQRQYVWDDGKASRLVESLLLNVPIPVCYFAEDDDFNFEVIDGLQRITSLRRFLDNEFALTGVTVLAEIRGKTFSQLAPRDQRRLESRTIRCVAITADSHPDIKFDVFERLNSNVAVLTAQELRNCVYRGDFNSSLRELATYEPLRLLIGSTGARRMVAEELVLRFLALHDGLERYRPPLRQFLNSYMRGRRHERIDHDEGIFVQNCLDTVIEVFGTAAFRLPDRSGNTHTTINKALYDAFMLTVATVDRERLLLQRDTLSDVVPVLLADVSFTGTLGRATADRARVFARVRKVGLILEQRGFPVGALEVVGRQANVK